MTDPMYCALTILALLGAYLMAEAIVDAFRDANRTIDFAIALCTTDPIDAHFDSIPAECTPCDSPTFSHLRADWGQWEQEVAG